MNLNGNSGGPGPALVVTHNAVSCRAKNSMQWSALNSVLPGQSQRLILMKLLTELTNRSAAKEVEF
jgi:hypothetical protein